MYMTSPQPSKHDYKVRGWGGRVITVFYVVESLIEKMVQRWNSPNFVMTDLMPNLSYD
jgi:hypothetical protein